MRIALFAALIILLNGFVSYLTNLPQDAGLDVPNGKLNSLSYAPFREGQSPLLQIFPTAEQIDEDLRLLAEKTHSIRTYASSQGPLVIPELARKHGLTLIHGAWVGYVKADIPKELDELVRAANEYPDVIKRVIVGNETLLRGEMKADELIGYIREVKRRVKQPVSYADVWSMYKKNPQLFNEVDFITIHILPYWEDEPIPVDKALKHIERVYKQMEQEAHELSPGKPILIGESGWPSEGRQRGWAIPSVVNEAFFIRGLLKIAAENHFDVNIVEAFNQPWKSFQEGVVGANWGLFSADRQEVFPLTGKVTENVKWLEQFAGSSLISLFIIVLYAKKLQHVATLKLLAVLAYIQILAALLIFYADKSWYTSYNDWQRMQTGLIVLLNAVVGWLVLRRAVDVCCRETTSKGVIVGLDTVYLLITSLMLYKTYLLAVDGRYISFPFEIAVIPVLGLLVLFIIQSLNGRFAFSSLDYNALIGRNPMFNQRAVLIAWLMLFYALGLIIGETKAFMIGGDFILAYPDVMERLFWAIIFTLTNLQLVGWLVCLIVFAISYLMSNKNEQNVDVAA
jgi:exo-beta-1,3-glucanase (GH17 family)